MAFPLQPCLGFYEITLILAIKLSFQYWKHRFKFSNNGYLAHLWANSSLSWNPSFPDFSNPSHRRALTLKTQPCLTLSQLQIEAAKKSAGPDLQEDGVCNENAALVCIGHWVSPKKLSYAVTTRASWPIGEGFCFFSCSVLMFSRGNWHATSNSSPTGFDFLPHSFQTLFYWCPCALVSSALLPPRNALWEFISDCNDYAELKFEHKHCLKILVTAFASRTLNTHTFLCHHQCHQFGHFKESTHSRFHTCVWILLFTMFYSSL